MIGKTLGHYEIVALLGRGGMSEVYRARDTRLDRDVAVKVLPADVAADPVRLERLEREAKTVAALSHPNIVTLYSVEEDAGVRFLTMELVEGRPLDAVLPAGGLPLPEAIGIGAAIADALEAAHGKGVVHRDLKPANVMIAADGRVKVMDFGIAKAVERSAGRPDDSATLAAPLTTEGTVVGTVPYMSPEQLRGRAVDARSDLFSLGIVLYEMATGRRPFGGASTSDIASAILRDAPLPMTEIRPGLPGRLERVVARCLEKEPGARYGSAREVRDALRALGAGTASDGEATEALPASGTRGAAAAGGARPRTGLVAAGIVLVAAVLLFLGRDLVRDREPSPAPPAATPPAVPGAELPSIAVLPFADMSPDGDQGYFSDGISEELLNLLTRIPGLKVAARTSSFSFKGKNVEVPEIGRQLNVEHVLEGSVRRSGDQVRITAQLIQAKDGFHVWSRTWDRTLDDIFAIQDEIAADVADELRITLLQGAPTTRKTDPRAFALYLQGSELAKRGTPGGFGQSDALLRSVLEIDSTYAPAWAARGANFANMAVSGAMPLAEGLAEARQANLRAVELDPGFAAAYAGLAFVAMYGESDFAAAARYLEKGLELSPSNGRVLANSATLLNLLGRREEALAMREAEAARDPLNVNMIFNLGTSRLNAGKLDEAIESFRTVLVLSPGNGVAHFQIAVAMLLKGDAEGALAEIEQETVEVFRDIGLPLVYHALGRKADSDAALAELIAKWEKDAAGNIAGVYAFRGEADAAFEWMEKERRAGGTFAEIVLDPLFQNLHADRRWEPFLREVGKAPEQLERIQFRVPGSGGR